MIDVILLFIAGAGSIWIGFYSAKIKSTFLWAAVLVLGPLLLLTAAEILARF